MPSANSIDSNGSISIFKRVMLNRRRAFFKFIDKKNPSANGYKLSYKNVFIFPTGRGFVYFAVIFSLWLLGTNYQNNLILALAFFMVALFILAIHITFLNLNSLEIRYLGAKEAFAGEDLSVTLELAKHGKHGAEEIELAWQDQLDEANEIPYVKEVAEQSISLKTQRRGRMKLPRIRVQTFFPFGILRCWTWLRFDAEVLVYPKPINGSLGKSSVTVDDQGDGLHAVKGGDDFSGLAEYVPGDSLKRVAWKSYARGRGLQVKEFNESLSSERWLDFDAIPASDIEERLSVMAFWVLHYFQENENFGLSLPGKKITPGSGLTHRTACLNALAVYQQ